MLCFRDEKCAKLHKQSQFTSKFIPTSVRDIFKESDLMDHSILQASDRSWKKSQILWVFRDRFTEIFTANFAEKHAKKNGQFHGNFLGKFR